MFTDLYLAFNDETEANSVLYTVTPEEVDEDGNVIVEASIKPNFRNIDVLGTVYEPRPVDADEDYVPVPYPAPNWGVNVRLIEGEDGSSLEPFAVSVPNPQRVWA